LNSERGGLLVNFTVFVATSAIGNGDHVSEKINSMKLTPLNRVVLDKADSHSAAHEILRLLQSPNVHDYVRKILPLKPILSGFK
jgi:hypothetical protein